MGECAATPCRSGGRLRPSKGVGADGRLASGRRRLVTALRFMARPLGMAFGKQIAQARMQKSGMPRVAKRSDRHGPRATCTLPRDTQTSVFSVRPRPAGRSPAPARTASIATCKPRFLVQSTTALYRQLSCIKGARMCRIYRAPSNLAHPCPRSLRRAGAPATMMRRVPHISALPDRGGSGKVWNGDICQRWDV